MEKIIIKFNFELHKLLDEKEIKFESINDYPKYMEYLLNTKYINEQIIKDLSGTGINKEMQIILLENLIEIQKLLNSIQKEEKCEKW